MSFIKINWWRDGVHSPFTKGNIFYTRYVISHMTVRHLFYLQQIASNKRNVFRNALSCGSSFKASLFKSLYFCSVPQKCLSFFSTSLDRYGTLLGPNHCWRGSYSVFLLHGNTIHLYGDWKEEKKLKHKIIIYKFCNSFVSLHLCKMSLC